MAEKKKRGSGFDHLVTDLMNAGAEEALLEDCMSREAEKISRVPLRYRLIALGFVKHMSLEELNRTLQNAGCAELYSRNIYEAGLIFAFLNGLSYAEWKELAASVKDIRASVSLKDGFFTGGTITAEDLRRYVEANSSDESLLYATKHLTRMMSDEIAGISVSSSDPSGRTDFRNFLLANSQSFSAVREKTRYYFCKYLYYDLRARIDRYASLLDAGNNRSTFTSGAGNSSVSMSGAGSRSSASMSGAGSRSSASTSDTGSSRASVPDNGFALEDALDNLSVFKSVSKLKRKKMTSEEARHLLMTSPVSCGEIFDALNYFYFGYISLDYMEIQLEYYGDIESLPENRKKKLAASLRRYNPALSGLDDHAVIAKEAEILKRLEDEKDDLYSKENAEKSYQLGRAGENSVRKYIRGELDPDRTTLTAFLLYLGSGDGIPETLRMSRGRLDHILLECGFSPLREEDDFDYFVIRYLKSDNPALFLTEEADRCALGDQNFYLYRMYRRSDSAEAEWRKLYS